MAQIVNGVWQTDPISRDAATHVKANASTAEFDGLVRNLSSIVVAAQNLSHADQRRMTEVILAAGSLMCARSRLDPADQKLFETALHEAVARKHGY